MADPTQKFRTEIQAVAQALLVEEKQRKADLAGVQASPDAAAIMTHLVGAISKLQEPRDVVAEAAKDPARLVAMCAAVRVVRNGITQVADLLAYGARIQQGDRERVVRPCPPAVVAALLGFGPRDPKFLGSAKR